MSERSSNLVDYFISQGVNINACDAYGQSILHAMVNYYEDDKTAYFLNRSDIEVMYRSNLRAIEDVLKFGAYVDISNIEGTTPLFIGASRGYAEVVELLLRWGANPGIVNAKGETAFDIASKGGFSETAKILEEAMGN